MIIVLKIIFIMLNVLIIIIFAGAEIAITSLESSGQLEDKKENKIKSLFIGIWKNSPLKVLNSILIGNNLFVMLISVIATTLAIDIANTLYVSKEKMTLLITTLVTIIVIFLGEIIPKILGRLYSERFFKLVYLIVYVFEKVMRPLNNLLSKFTFWTSDMFGLDIRSSAPKLTDKDVKDFLDIGEADGIIGGEEKEVIESLIDFEDVTVNEIKISRAKMDCIDIESGFDNIVKKVSELKHSRIPVYKGNFDNIVGILYSKDLLFAWQNRDILIIEDIIRPVYYIPPTKKINDLLVEFKKGQYHIAVIINEYGTVQGLVTIEDIIEEIFGDILDEYDIEENKIEKLSDGSFLIDAGADLSMLNEKFGLNFEDIKNVNTISGYIFFILGRLPSKNEIINTKDATFLVAEMDKKIIKKVVLRKK